MTRHVHRLTTLLLLVTPVNAYAQSGLPGDVVLPGPKSSPAVPPSAEGRVLRSISIVALDPGHGGDDIGARAIEGGAVEKDVALAIARRIEARITAETSARTVWTRSDDTRRSADERASTSNQARADVFLSIHANGGPAPTARGFTVLYHEGAWGAAGDRSEASAERGEPTRIAWRDAQRRSEGTSAHLAEMLRSALTAKVALPDRGVRRAPLASLESVLCPAVILEVGFLSNPDDARALATPAVQDAFAEGVLAALLALDDELSGGTSEEMR